MAREAEKNDESKAAVVADDGGSEEVVEVTGEMPIPELTEDAVGRMVHSCKRLVT